MASGQNIVFMRTYPGNWVKKIVERKTGDKLTDPYLFTPDGQKIRSSVELLKYIKANPQHWATFDAYEINVERSKERLENPSSGTRKVIHFLECVNAGMTIEEAEESQGSLKKVKSTSKSKYRRKNYSKNYNQHQFLGSKSIRKNSKYRNKTLSREIVNKLEEHFLKATVAPTDEQMELMAIKLGADFELVKKWFNFQWKGRLNYQFRKSKVNVECSRTRPFQFFDPEIDLDSSFSLVLHDKENFIEIDNGELDYDYQRTTIKYDIDEGLTSIIDYQKPILELVIDDDNNN